MLLAECARPGGPRGEIGHCPGRRRGRVGDSGALLAAFPRWGFLGEETAAQAAADGEDHVWVVDPNDGTTSMQRGYRGHAVSVGLVRHGRTGAGRGVRGRRARRCWRPDHLGRGLRTTAAQRRCDRACRRADAFARTGGRGLLVTGCEPESGGLSRVCVAGALRESAQHRLSAGAGRDGRLRGDGLAESPERLGLRRRPRVAARSRWRARGRNRYRDHLRA